MKDRIFGYTPEAIRAMQQGTYSNTIAKRIPGKDYGYDPLGNGKVKLVPSGRVVTIEEAREILGR